MADVSRSAPVRPARPRHVVPVRLSEEEHEAAKRSANRAGITFSAYVRRCLEESRQLEDALELEVEDRRREQEARGACLPTS